MLPNQQNTDPTETLLRKLLEESVGKLREEIGGRIDKIEKAATAVRAKAPEPNPEPPVQYAANSDREWALTLQLASYQVNENPDLMPQYQALQGQYQHWRERQLENRLRQDTRFNKFQENLRSAGLEETSPEYQAALAAVRGGADETVVESAIVRKHREQAQKAAEAAARERAKAGRAGEIEGDGASRHASEALGAAGGAPTAGDISASVSESIIKYRQNRRPDPVKAIMGDRTGHPTR